MSLTADLPPSPMRRLRRGAVVLSGALLLAGCAGLSGEGAGLFGEQERTEAPANEGFDSREAELGQREHPRIVASFGGIFADPDVQAYLDTMVADLGDASDEPDLNYKVTVLNSPTINAFSLPGGYLYVSRGLLSLANDASELAAVLAHEMAHVTARHAIEREEQAVAATVAGQVIGDVLRESDAGDAALAMTRGRMAQFSRQQELEADAVGIRTAARAGFDPDGSVRFLRALERQTELHSRALHQTYEPGRVDIYATHPATPQRILAAEREARVTSRRREARRDAEAFLSVIDGIPYGDDPREGLVQGRTFIHPQLGITFSVPEGFALENTRGAVVGFADTGDIIRFDSVEVATSVDLADYLAHDAVQGGEVSDVEQREIGGLPAALATVGGNSWDFRVAAIRGADETVYRFILASRELDDDRAARLVATAETFRLLEPDVARQARQQRVRVVRVGPDDTVESLARRMDFDDHHVARFRALNGLSPSDRVKPGQFVKLVER